MATNTVGIRDTRRDPDALLTVAEAADFLRVSHAFVRHHASGFREPKIPSIKLGKLVRFQRRDLIRYANSQKRSA